MTMPPYPFGSDSWGTDIDDTVEIRAAGPFPVDPWREFPVFRMQVGNIVGRVLRANIRPPAWEACVVIGGNVRDLGWFHTAAEGKAAVEQVINELAPET